ncbi:MAG: ATP-binding protein [Anaerolineae bacterium]
MNVPIRIKLELPATFQFLNVLSGCISEMLNRVDDIADRNTLVYQLQLAAQELCTNIVEHAYQGQSDGRIEVLIEVDEADRQIALTFGDNGAAYDISIPAVTTIEEPSEGGMGLFLIRQLMDQVDYRRDGQWNLWKITKRYA